LNNIERGPTLRRTWLFGPGADADTHRAMTACGADVLIQDLEDFTPPDRRPQARHLAPALYRDWKAAGAVACARINALEADGPADLEAVMAAGASIIAYPKAVSADQMRALDAAITRLEARHAIAPGRTESLPVCETALGVVNVREIAAASARIRCALLGAEDLAADLCAERGPDAIELDHARRRFILECRAASMEPVDAPYTFADAEGAVRETTYARRLGYRSKSLVRPEHVSAIRDVLTPSAAEIERAHRIIDAFDAARARGEDRVLVDGLWIEVPTQLNAKRLLERARQFGLPTR
jgi:citrate lyase subunit beta/citryl-CoA lyase